MLRVVLSFCVAVVASVVVVDPTDGAPVAGEPVFALVGGRVYVSPTEAPIADGVVLVRGSRIVAVGSKGEVGIPREASSVDCTGHSIFAGFWNSHVHFIEDKWNESATLPAAQLTAHLQEMLTRYGFVHVFETATFDLDDTLALRRRIAGGEVLGPFIYTTGEPFVPPNGTPAYLHPKKLDEIATPAEARDFVRRQLAAGADGIKFWAASPNSWTTTVTMPIEIARAAVSAADAERKPVFAHPTTVRGVRIAAESGVDVLVHTSPDHMELWDDDLVGMLREKNVALIPTLKLYLWDPERQGVSAAMIERVVDAAIGQLRQYATAGGEILFGTDVGYVTDYDPMDEFRLMQRAGLSFEEILASLTTAPARRFGAFARTGRIASGMDADLVVMRGDPSKTLEAFGNVQRVYAKGRLIYQTARR